MGKSTSEPGARGILEIVEAEIEKKSRKLAQKWILSPILKGLEGKQPPT